MCSFLIFLNLSLVIVMQLAAQDPAPDENLALGRPATQSSTYFHQDAYLTASRAVDGKYTSETIDYSAAAFSCSHTNDSAGGPNWWRVQLDRPYPVRRVVVTGRSDCCAERLDYFIVGVTNSTDVPVRGAYPLCGQYPSKMTVGKTVTFHCNLPTKVGQYVIIQQPSNGPGRMALCEVEVYSGPCMSTCSNGFDYVREINQCLYLNVELLTWDKARIACATKNPGSELVSIKDAAKQEAISKYLQQKFIEAGSQQCYNRHYGVRLAWIGGRRKIPNRPNCKSPFVWKYNRENDIPFSFTKWSPRTPDCYHNNEHCVQILTYLDYSWNDFTCTAPLCSVCEI